MSLLLDALKRAEQEKLARQGEASNDAAPGAPSPAPAAKPGPSFELQPIAPMANGPAQRDAAGAQILFDAKVSAEPKRGRGMLWATLGAIAIVVASAAGYVWYQLRLLAPAPMPVVARRPLPPPLPQTSMGSVPTAEPFKELSRPAPATVTVAREPQPAEAPPLPQSAAAPVAVVPQDPVARLLREAPRPEAPPLKLARTLDRPTIAPQVSAGYDSLRRGDLTDARRQYDAALAADAMSLDARLGMATVEARSGNRTMALAHYRRALELDPRNPTALAGLAALADNAAPEAVESQLREDVARFPESAALRFALGTHYARQRRWGEAQAAFFEAHRLDPTGADILYNLAVSLDHMSQPRLAADFYRRAVEAAQSQPTQFDPATARRRVSEIAGR